MKRKIYQSGERFSRSSGIVLIVITLICAAIFIFGVPAETNAQKRKVTPKQESKVSGKRKPGKRPLRSDKRSKRESERAVTIVRNGKKYYLTEDKDLARFDQPAERMEWYLKKRLPKGEKVLPVERYFQAREKIKKMRRFSSAKKKILPSQAEARTETEIDPEFPNSTGGGGAGDGSASTSGALGTWQSLGPGNVGGRTRALLINPSNPNVMYAAGVAGGIWKTTNGGTSWSALDDFLANIAVTSMAFDPTNSNIIYAGTGEGFFNADGVRGAGIFKTIDAGVTWTRLAATANNSNFFFVNDVVVSSANNLNVYAATRSGVWRSLDGGTSWTQVLVSNSANGANGAMDLVMRTDQSTDYIFAAVGSFAQSHIWRNTDAGGTGVWTDVYTETTMGRTSLAIAPSNQSVIYAMSACISCPAGTNPNFPTASYTDGLLGVFRSTTNGDAGSWTTRVRNNSANLQDTLLLSNPVNGALTQCGIGVTQFFNQGWYDNVIAVDPTDENKVWAGGIDLFRSDNGGTNWGVASYWWFQGNGTPPNNGDPQLVHADNHIIAFHPGYNGTTNQTMIVGNDGGIYKTDNANTGNVGYTAGTTPAGGTVTPASPICGAAFAPGEITTVPTPVLWGPLNNGYGVTQFFHGLPYPNGQTYFGGTQDNGTNRGTDAAGVNAWSRIFGGDGGYVAVNPANTNHLFLETTGLSIRRSTNGGTSFSTVTTGISGDAFPFITVFRMDPTTPTRLWIGGRFMWRTDNNATNWTRTSNAQQTGGSITAMAIAPTDSNIVINGAASGQLRRTTIGLTANSASVLNSTWLQSFTPRGNGFGGISWVEYDPSNVQNVWATVSNFNSSTSGNGFGHVFKSTDGGATWTLADGNQTPGNVNAIPDIPAHSVVVDPNDSQRIYVGTDLGVFVSLDGGQNWARETTGFSNVPVESLSVVNNNGVTSIFAFTHGRGAFKVTIPSSCVSVSPANQAFFSPGAPGGVTVTKNLSATATCDWNAVSNDSFITINSGTSGNNNGTVSFTVAQNTTGVARTGTLTVAGQNITITQDAAPNANDDTATTDEDTPVDINVKTNDSDPDGDTLTVTTVTQGANGTVTINMDGTIRYAPALNYFGADSFTYTINDGHGGTDTANVNVTINSVNDAPTANPDSYSTVQNTPLNVAAPGVLGNDSDPDAGNTITAVLVSGPTNAASFALNADGSFNYTPTAGFTGTDSFTYQARDNLNADSGVVTVTLNVQYRFAWFYYSGLLLNEQVLNQVTAGSNVPVRFTLYGYKGNPYSMAPTSQQINCATFAPVGAATTINRFMPDPFYTALYDFYQTTWQTQGAWKFTCRELTLHLNDGTTRKLKFYFK